MSHSEDELERMLERAYDLPFGEAKTAVVEQVIAHADAGGHDELAYAARMFATSAYTHGGEPAKAFVTFSRCLSEFDQEPRPYHERFVHDLLWQFKWMVNAMTRFPEISLTRTRAVLDDMDRRYRDGGHSPHPVLAYRHRVAVHIGDLAAAEGLYEQWCAAPLDSLSDCRACDPSAKAWYLGLTGRDEEAVALAEPVVSGAVTCLEQPQYILTNLLVSYVRTGRHQEAVAAHRSAYRAARTSRAELGLIADHVKFCARTGNEVRGLEVVRRHMSWLDNPPTPMAAMEFAAAAALVLSRLAAAGQGDLTVARAGAEVPVATLAKELATAATALAARFDERNGTPYQGELVAATLTAEPLMEYLPLSPTARGSGPRSPVAPPPPVPPPPPPPPPPVPAEAGPDALLELAVARSMVEDWPGTEAALRAFDERFAGADLDPRVRALRLDWRGMQLMRAGDAAGAVAYYRQAADALVAAGAERQAQATRSRLGQLLCQLGQVEEGLPLVEAAAAYMAVHGDPQRRAAALLRKAEVLVQLGQGESGLDTLAEALAHAAASGQPHLLASVALSRAYALTELGRQEAPAAAEEACRRYRPLGGDGYAHACLLAAGLRDEPATALPLVQEAVRAAGPDSALAARHALASVLGQLGRLPEAVEEHLEAVALATAAGDEPGAAAARVGLAGAYLAGERLVEAAEAAEEALAMLTEGAGSVGGVEGGEGAEGDLVGLRDECRELLMQVYGQLGEVEPALAQVEALLASYGGFDHAGNRGRLQEFAGELLWHVDRDADAAGRFAAAVGEYGTAGGLVDEVRARRRAMLATQFGGDPVAARTALAEVDARTATLLGDTLAGDAEPAARWEAAMVGYDGARLLAADGRLEEAADRLAPLAARFRAVEAFEEAFLSEALRGQILLDLGRADEAVPVLKEVTKGLPRDHPARGSVAGLLAAALEANGDARGAAKIRKKYGIEEDLG